MKRMRRALIILTVTLMAAGTHTVLAQDPGGAQSPQQAAKVAQGELVKVDASAMTIVINSAGSQMQFSYTPETRVSGAEKGVAGLATMTGTPVTVHFTTKGQTNVATEIEVQKKS